MPNASDRLPMFASMSSISDICGFISGKITTVITSITAIAPDQISSARRLRRSSCKKTVMSLSLLGVIVEEDLLKIGVGDGDIRKRKPRQRADQLRLIAAV